MIYFQASIETVTFPFCCFKWTHFKIDISVKPLPFWLIWTSLFCNAVIYISKSFLRKRVHNLSLIIWHWIRTILFLSFSGPRGRVLCFKDFYDNQVANFQVLILFQCPLVTRNLAAYILKSTALSEVPQFLSIV